MSWCGLEGAYQIPIDVFPVTVSTVDQDLSTRLQGVKMNIKSHCIYNCCLYL